VCDAGTCLALPVDGMGAVTCRLDRITADLRTAAPADVGGAVPQSRLVARIATVHRTLDGTAGKQPSRAARKRALRQLRTFSTTVQLGKRRRHIRADLADRILDTLTEATTDLMPLKE